MIQMKNQKKEERKGEQGKVSSSLERDGDEKKKFANSAITQNTEGRRDGARYRKDKGEFINYVTCWWVDSGRSKIFRPVLTRFVL